MGRVFLDHPGGLRIYSCANCDTPLTNRSELVSTVSGKEGFAVVCMCPVQCVGVAVDGLGQVGSLYIEAFGTGTKL